MFDNNNHSLSDLSKLILIRTSFDGKNDEIEIKINNSNFNDEKNKIYFILDFFNYEIYQVKNVYNKNNILIKNSLKTENNIFRLNEIRKLDDISFSPNSFQTSEPMKILVINCSEPCSQNFSLDLININTNASLGQYHQPLSPIDSKIRFILTVSKPGIFKLVLKCIDKTIDGLNNSKLYIYNSQVTLVRKKDYILNNTGNNIFPIYLKFPVLEGQFSIKKKDSEEFIEITDFILTNETIIEVPGIDSHKNTIITITDLADNNAEYNFTIISTNYIINNTLIFYKSSLITTVTQKFELNITTLNTTTLNSISVHNGFSSIKVNCFDDNLNLRENKKLITCNGTNITSNMYPREFILSIGNENISRSIYIIYYNIENSCQYYSESEITIHAYYPNTLTENFNLYSNISNLGIKLDNFSFNDINGYPFYQTIFILKTVVQLIGKHELYGSITDYNETFNYIKDDYLTILEFKYVKEFEVIKNEKSLKFLTNTNDTQIIRITLNKTYYEETIEKIFLNKNENYPIIESDECIPESDENITYNCIFQDLSSQSVGEYKIGYTNLCRDNTFFKYSSSNNTVTVNIYKQYNILNITPNYIFNDENVSTIKVFLDDNLTDYKDMQINIFYDNNTNSSFGNDNIKDIKVENNTIIFDLNFTNKPEEFNKTLTPYITFNSNENFPRIIHHPNPTINQIFKIGPRLNFIFNHHHFILNDSETYDFEPMLIIKPKSNENVSDIQIWLNGNNFSMDKNDTHYYKKIEEEGDYYFNYIDKTSGIVVNMLDYVRCRKGKKSFIKINEELNNCFYNKFELSFFLTNDFIINYKDNINITLKNDENQINLEDQNPESLVYKINSEIEVNEKYNFIIKEASKDYLEDGQYIYIQKDITFTDFKLNNSVRFKNSTSIKLKDVICKFEGDLFLKTNNDTPITNINCNSSIYDQSNNELTCQMVNPYNSFGEHFLFYNNKNLTNKVFISNSLYESNWSVSKNDSVKESEETITLTNDKNDFYIQSNLTNITYYLFNKSNTITKFVKNENYVKFKVNHGANYIIIIDKLYREQHDEDDINSISGNLLYHQFNYTYYHILYFLDKNLIFYTGKDGDHFYYNITLNFSNEDSLKNNQENININDNECDILTISGNIITCNVTIDINSSNPEVKKNVSLDLENSDYPLYEIYYNLNAICLNDSNTDDYTLYFISHNDIGNIKLNFNEDINGTSKNINDSNSKNTTFTIKNEIAKNYKNSPFIAYISNKNITSEPINLNIVIVPEYSIKSINSNKFKALKDQEIIITFNQTNINKNHFNSFFISNSTGNKGTNTSKISQINDNTLSVIFDFNDVSGGIYYLFFTDKCNNEFNSTLTIDIVKFSQKRYYYVITNNYNNTESTQYKTINNIIYGPKNLTIYAYLNGSNTSYILGNNEDSNEYYLSINESFVGNLTYKYYLDGEFYDTGLITHIVNTYDKLYNISGPKECYLLNETNSFNFKLSTSDNSFEGFDLSNISIYFLNPKKNDLERYSIFENDSDSDEDSDEFSIDIKDKLVENETYTILITEFDDYFTPLYAYKISYTNISLHQDFTEFIYINSPYILFNTSCFLSIPPNFTFFNEVSSINFTCSNMQYNKTNSELTCNLDNSYQSEEDVDDEKDIYRLYKSDDDFGYYDLSILDYQMLAKNIFLTLPINKAKFELYKDDYIEVGYGNNIYLTSNNFYIKNIQNVSIFANNTKLNEKPFQFNSSKKLDINEKDNSKSKILLSDNLINNILYCVNKIYRNDYEYIDNNDNSNIKLKDYGNKLELCFEVTALVVNWDISKRYIVINDTYENESFYYYVTLYALGEEISQIDTIYYKTYSNNRSTNEGEETIYKKNDLNQNNYSFFVDNETELKYSIYYNYTKGTIKEFKGNRLLVDFPVLVVKNVSQLLNFTISSTCIYSNLSNYQIYNTLNYEYDFFRNISKNHLQFYFTNSTNEITGSYFAFNLLDNYYEYSEPLSLRNLKLILVENPSNRENLQFPIYSIDINITNFTTNFDDFYYKDNIIFNDSNCVLNDLKLAKISDYNEANKTYKEYFNLDCSINNSGRGISCKTNATFTNNYKDNFNLIYNNETISENLSIYNSIDEGNYYIAYPNGIKNDTDVTIVINSPNFDMTKIKNIKINQTDISNNEVSPKDISDFNKTNSSISFILNKSSAYNYTLTQLEREEKPNNDNDNKVKNLSIAIELNIEFLIDKEYAVLSRHNNNVSIKLTVLNEGASTVNNIKYGDSKETYDINYNSHISNTYTFYITQIGIKYFGYTTNNNSNFNYTEKSTFIANNYLTFFSVEAPKGCSYINDPFSVKLVVNDTNSANVNLKKFSAYLISENNDNKNYLTFNESNNNLTLIDTSKINSSKNYYVIIYSGEESNIIYHSKDDENKIFCFNAKVNSFGPDFIWSNDNVTKNFKIVFDNYKANCNDLYNTIGKKFSECNVDGNIVNLKMNLFNEPAGNYFITLNNKELVGFYVVSYDVSGKSCSGSDNVDKFDIILSYEKSIPYEFEIIPNTENITRLNGTDNDTIRYYYEQKINNETIFTINVKNNESLSKNITEFNLSTENINFDNIILSSDLVEGQINQEVNITFEELNSDIKFVITNTTFEKLLDCVKNGNTLNCKVDLINVVKGNYSLIDKFSCSNNHIERTIEVKELICSNQKKEFYNNSGKFECKYCEEIHGSSSHFFINSENSDDPNNYKCSIDDTNKCDTKGKFYGLEKLDDENHYYCTNCSKIGKKLDVKNTYCVDNCINGTISTESKCYLNDDEEVLTLDPSERCNEYCANNQTCKLDHNEEPYCDCGEKFKGLYCEINISVMNLDDNFKLIDNQDSYFNLDDANSIAVIRSIISTVAKDKESILDNTNKTYINNYLKSAYNTRQNFNKELNSTIQSDSNNNNYKHIYEIFELELFLRLDRFNKNTRKLAEDESDSDNDEAQIDSIINSAHEINRILFNNIDLSKVKKRIDRDDLNLIQFSSYKRDLLKTEPEFNALKKDKATVLDFSNCSDCDSVYITSISSKAINYKNQEKKENITGLYIKANGKKKNDNNEINFLTATEYYTLYINNETLDINFNLFKAYKNKSVNIYKKNDECFKDKCWISDGFNFDLTQNYRRFNVYQRKNFNDSFCEINENQNETEIYELNCNLLKNQFNEGEFLEIHTTKNPYESKHVDNLPTKCLKKGKKQLYNNAGFWLFLISILILIIASILIQISSYEKLEIEEKMNEIAIDNDNLDKNEYEVEIDNYGNNLYEYNNYDDNNNNNNNDINNNNDSFNYDDVKNNGNGEKMYTNTNYDNNYDNYTNNNMKEKNSQLFNNDSNLKQTKIVSNPPAKSDNYDKNSNNFNEKNQNIESNNNNTNNDNDNNDNNDNTNNNKNINPLNPSTISLRYQSFSELLKANFLELHPICTIFHASIISPIIFNLWVFVFNSLLYFGWNALYYTETKIKFRIIRDYRHNFAYPMKHDFDKIVLSLVTTMACCLLVRVIVMVSKERRDQLNIEIKSGNKEDRRESRIEFENEMLPQRLIAMALMLGVLLFFFIYCVVFCAVYKNSQASLMYSGIWTLLFVWVLLAPVFIVGISLVEFKVNRGCGYYLKRLFLF